jgi:hypothetical protein
MVPVSAGPFSTFPAAARRPSLTAEPGSRRRRTSSFHNAVTAPGAASGERTVSSILARPSRANWRTSGRHIVEQVRVVDRDQQPSPSGSVERRVGCHPQHPCRVGSYVPHQRSERPQQHRSVWSSRSIRQRPAGNVGSRLLTQCHPVRRILWTGPGARKRGGRRHGPTGGVAQGARRSPMTVPRDSGGAGSDRAAGLTLRSAALGHVARIHCRVLQVESGIDTRRAPGMHHSIPRQEAQGRTHHGMDEHRSERNERRRDPRR